MIRCALTFIVRADRATKSARELGVVDNESIWGLIGGMKLADFPQLWTASPAEKIALIDELWASIPPELLATPESHLAELDRRIGAFQSGLANALTPEEARRRIRAKVGI